MIDSKGGAFGFDCCLASPKFCVFQQPARSQRRVPIAAALVDNASVAHGRRERDPRPPPPTAGGTPGNDFARLAAVEPEIFFSPFSLVRARCCRRRPRARTPGLRCRLALAREPLAEPFISPPVRANERHGRGNDINHRYKPLALFVFSCGKSEFALSCRPRSALQKWRVREREAA
jgi:hypothetical protein